MYTLEHFYDFIEDNHGVEMREQLQKLIEEHVSRETQKLQKNIKIYSYGFNQALHHIDGYESRTKIRLDDYDDSNILKAKRLDDKIYHYFNQPDYGVEI